MRRKALSTLVSTLLLAAITAASLAAQGSGRAAMLRQQAQSLYGQAKLAEAAELYQRAAILEGTPELKAEALVTAAWLEHQLERFEEAKQTLTEALVAYPDFPFLPELYDPEFEAAYYDALQTARVRRQNLAKAKTDEAIEKLERGWTQEAGELLREVLELLPNDPKVLYNLALVEIQQDHFEEATTALQRVVALSYSARDSGPVAREYRRRALFRLGLLYYDREYYEEAAQHLGDAVRMDADRVDAWRVLGLARRQLGDLEGAIEALRRAVDLSPDDESLVGALVAALQESGDWREVFRVARGATGSFQRNARLWLSLGQAAHRIRDTGTSIDALERVLQLDGENRDDLARQAAGLLASQYLALDRYDDAERRARQWLGWEPRVAEAHSILATALQRRGLTADALPHHLEALALEPRSARLAFNAGSAHLELGQLRQAADQFGRALGLEPGSPEALDSLDAIRLHIRNANALLGMRLSDSPTGAGALVSNVDKRTPAAKANLKPGDVIRRFDGRAVTSSDEFGYLLNETTAFEVTLEFARGNKRKQGVLRLR